MWVNPQLREEIQQQLHENWPTAASNATPDVAPDATSDAAPDKLAPSRGEVPEKNPAAGAVPGAGLWVVDELVVLLVAYHDQSTDTLRSKVRRLVLEHMFTADGGDSVMAHDAPSMDSQVDMIVHVLENARQRAFNQGDWSNQPAAPLMCG